MNIMFFIISLILVNPIFAGKNRVRELKNEAKQHSTNIKKGIERFNQRKAELEKIILTTTINIEGFRVEKYLGIESVEIVMGTGPISELFSDFSDFLGQRSTKFEKKLQKAKEMAFARLKQIALNKFANAIIGIDLDYTEFTRNRIGLIVNGTLVKIVPK